MSLDGMKKEHIFNLSEEFPLLFLLVTLPFIGVQSVRDFIFPYNLIFFIGVAVFFVLRIFRTFFVDKEPDAYLSFGQISVFLFLVSGFVSFLFSKYPYGNKVEFSQIIAYISLAFALAGNRKGRIPNKVIWLLLGLGFLESVYSLFQVQGIDFFSWSVNFNSRGFGTLVNPNHFAGYLALIFPLGLYLFCANESKIIKSISGIFLVFIVTGIVGSSSQGGILAFGLSLAFFLYFLFKKNILKTEDKTYFTIIAFIILIVNFSLYSLNCGKQENLANRVSQIMEEENPSIEGRLLNWAGTLRMIKDKPLLGWGPGTYKDVFIKYRPVEFNKFEPAEHPRLYAHNDFLQLISELGIIGFSFFVLMLFTFYRNIKKEINGENPLFYLTLGSCVIAGLMAGFFNTAFTFHYFIMPSACLFWVMLGMGLQGDGYEKLKIKKGLIYSLLLVFLLWGLFFQIKTYRGSSWNFKADPSHASNIDEENDNFRYQLAGQYFAKYLEINKKKYLDLAKSELHSAIKLNPFSGVYHYQLALIYLEEDPVGLENSIEDELSKAIELNPSDVMAYILKAEKKLEKQDLNSAIEIYRQIYRIEQGDKNSDIYSNTNLLAVYKLMGQFYYGKRQLQKSAYFYEKFMSRLPEKGAAFNNLGALYLEMKNYEKAEESFNKAISLEPENIDFHWNLAYTYKITNRLDAYNSKMEEIEKLKAKKKI